MVRKTRKSNPVITRMVTYVVVVIFAGFSIMFCYNRGLASLRNTEIFKIKEVTQSPSLGFMDPQYLESFKGKSLFEVNLTNIQKYLQNKYPDMDHLRVVMVFPNRIVVQAQKREPFAIIENSRKDIVVDHAGVIIHSGLSIGAALPRIRGINLDAPKDGNRGYPQRELKVAIKIIDTITGNQYLSPYRIENINMAHPSNIELYLNHGIGQLRPLFVILDQDNIQQKIQKLGILLSQGELDLKSVKYIDLRFHEPILSKQ